MTPFRSLSIAALAIAAAVLIAVVPAAAAKKSCALYGGDASMLTTDLAKFMANAALTNSMKAAGAAPSGDVKMACTGTGLVTCQARQRACK
jgi:hypothetical protein